MKWNSNNKDRKQVFSWIYLVLIRPQYNEWRMRTYYDTTLEQIVYSETSLSRQARGEGLAELVGIPT